eukprot:3154620-Pleurochrysis_carterae.AAC.1
MSSAGAPGSKRRAAAASRSRRKPSSMSCLPVSRGRPPSVRQARRASSTMWKSTEPQAAPPLAITCSTPSSPARCPRPSRMSAAATSNSTRPQRPRPSKEPVYVPARVSDASGLCPLVF